MNRYYNTHDYDLDYLQDVLAVLGEDVEDNDLAVMGYKETAGAINDDIATVTFEIEVGITDQSDIAYLLDLDRMFENP